MRKYRYAVYTRVSTDQQSTELQFPEIVAHLAAHGIPVQPLEQWSDPRKPPEVPGVLWLDENESGVGLDSFNLRAGMKAIDQAVVGRHVDNVLIWRLDRLGRNSLGIMQFVQHCEASATNLISIREGIDLSTPAGRLMLTVIASIAQFEAEVRSERQRAGIMRRREKCRRIMELHSQGKSPRDISSIVHLELRHVEKVIQRKGGLWYGGWEHNRGRPWVAKRMTKERLAMYLLEGLSRREIARIFGVCSGTVANRIKMFGLDPKDICPEAV